MFKNLIIVTPNVIIKYMEFSAYVLLFLMVMKCGKKWKEKKCWQYSNSVIHDWMKISFLASKMLITIR